MYTKVKTEEELEKQRKSGQIVAAIFSFLEKETKDGMTTKEIADLAHEEIKRLGGKSAVLGFMGYPSSMNISINDEVVHGLPSDKVVKDGDIITYDVVVDYKGMKADAAYTHIVGGLEPTPEVKNLIEGTREALYAGIDVIKDGVRVGDISAAIEAVLEKRGLSVIKEYVGHGVGHEVHEEPGIANYGIKGTGDTLREGMTIALEPMASLGSEWTFEAADEWTVKTEDGSLSAQWEHTVLITKDGAEILTESSEA